MIAVPEKRYLPRFMFLDFTKIEDGRLVEAFSLAPDDPLLEGYGGEVRGPIEVVAELAEPAPGTLVVTVNVKGRATASCSRCLESIELAIEERIELAFQEPPDDVEDEDDGDTGEFSWLDPDADGIEIGEVVRDRLFLEMQMFPLCRPDCGGLCPACGRRQDEAPCDCRTAPDDPRWDALRRLNTEDNVQGNVK